MASGLSTRDSANDFAAHYRAFLFHKKELVYPHRDEGGTPTTKHLVCYGDETRQGIAWRYGWWGSLAPDGDPAAPLEMISVHLPGKPVLIDPDGADSLTLNTEYKEKYGYPSHRISF